MKAIKVHFFSYWNRRNKTKTKQKGSLLLCLIRTNLSLEWLRTLEKLASEISFLVKKRNRKVK